LVRLLEQLTLYAAALDASDAPTLARLMRSTCDKLRSQHDKADALGRLNSSLSLALSSASSSPDDEWEECAACEELKTHPEVCMSGRENCGESGAYRCYGCDHLVCICYFHEPGNPDYCVECHGDKIMREALEVARLTQALEPFSPSKPGALNADSTAATSEVGSARISTPTPIQGRDDKQ